MKSHEPAFVLGQRRTLAALALGVALLSFLNLAGLEKAILAIVLGLKALSRAPQPALEARRGWARLAIGLAAAHVVLVVTVILLNLDRLSRLLDALRAMSDLR
jgi:pilus assembly protein TadC